MVARFILMLVFNTVYNPCFFTFGQHKKINCEVNKQVPVDFYPKSIEDLLNLRLPDSVLAIGLGEVTHGGWEPMEVKLRIVQFLVKKKNYRNLLIEYPDFGPISLLREYLNDAESIDSNKVSYFVDRMSILPINKVIFKRLFSWIKCFNLTHAYDMITLSGIDVAGKHQTKSNTNLLLYKYLIPNHYEGADYFIHNKNPDKAAYSNVMKWVDSETNVKTRLLQDGYNWLEYFLQNAIAGIEYDSLKIVEKSNNAKISLSNIFRDSVMASNTIRVIGEKKSIVWAHSGHVARIENQLGELLNRHYNGRYYVLLTDFSDSARVAVVPDYVPSNLEGIHDSIFLSNKESTAYKLKSKSMISQQLFFRDNISNLVEPDKINVLDLRGIHFVFKSINTFDALYVLKTITTGL